MKKSVLNVSSQYYFKVGEKKKYPYIIPNFKIGFYNSEPYELSKAFFRFSSLFQLFLLFHNLFVR